MKYVDEFRDARLIRGVVHEIAEVAAGLGPVRIMEVCGGHTHALFRFGLLDLLPPTIEFLHGPGCPVCILPRGRLDEGLTLATSPGILLATFGDVMRVPGTRGSLLDVRAAGGDVRMVYSPLDALRLAERHPERQVVFLAIGFETTAPATALTLLQAQAQQIRNFAVHCNHVILLPALRSVLGAPDQQVDALIGPGHVSSVIGCRPYQELAEEFRCPIVVSGFEPLDLLQAVLMIVRQLGAGVARVENQYSRVVSWDGNPTALQALARVFRVRPQFAWRGLGELPESGYALQPEFAPWDAENLLLGTRREPGPAEAAENSVLRILAEPDEARCGEVLRGASKPRDCPLFGKECRPEQPIGALMVSSEGACAAHFKYQAR